MRQQRRIAIACLGALFVCSAAWGAPRNSQQNAPDASAEQRAYLAAHNEKDAQAQIKLLDDFSAKYPQSAVMPEAYRDYYEAYFRIGEYPQAIDYADKLVALGDKAGIDMRVLAILTREVAYSADCSQPELRTQDAYTRARDAGKQGLALFPQWRKPENLTQEQFAAEKKSFGIILAHVAQMGAAGLAGRSIGCPSNPPDPGNFNQMIRDIQEQEQQTPDVR